MTIDTCQIHQYTELDEDGECPTCKALGSSPCSALSDLLPHQHIIEAARTVSEWMKREGYNNWQLGECCARSFADQVDTLRRERNEARADVHRLLEVFRRNIHGKHPTVERIASYYEPNASVQAGP